MTKKKLLCAAGIGGSVVAMSSVAFACTTYVGKMTVKGNRTQVNGPSVTVHGANIAGRMDYCNLGGEPTGKAAIDQVGGSLTITLAPSPMCGATGGPLDPAYDDFNPLAGSGTGGSNTLPAADYTVSYRSTGFEYTNVADNPLSRQYITDCMWVGAQPGGDDRDPRAYVPNDENPVKTIRATGDYTITVNGSGNGSETFTGLNTMGQNLWDPSSPFTTDESAICVSKVVARPAPLTGSTQYGLQAPFFSF
ncbi:MAG TPA: hypothetical protein VNA57_11920 [Acidimicrobiales bacterium]|nr:hypothetical protein [Acidimicrobiales bacterium]